MCRKTVCPNHATGGRGWRRILRPPTILLGGFLYRPEHPGLAANTDDGRLGAHYPRNVRGASATETRGRTRVPGNSQVT